MVQPVESDILPFINPCWANKVNVASNAEHSMATALIYHFFIGRQFWFVVNNKSGGQVPSYFFRDVGGNYDFIGDKLVKMGNVLMEYSSEFVSY